MPLMDEFKEERQSIKNASFRDKLSYFWYYYKTHTIITLFVLVVGITTISEILSQKENAFFALLLNSVTTGEEQSVAFTQNFADYSGIDTEKYDVMFDNSIIFAPSGENVSLLDFNELNASASERLLVYTASGTVDVILAGSDIFPGQAIQEMFCDLRDILSSEQLAAYEPYFYYVDQTYLDAVAKAKESETTDNASAVDLNVFPDPLNPDAMEQPVPVGILVSDCNKLTEAHMFGGDYTVLGVMVNAPHPHAALQFIDYLFE